MAIYETITFIAWFFLYTPYWVIKIFLISNIFVMILFFL